MGKIHWAIVCLVFLSCIFLGNKGVKGVELDVSEIISKVWWKYRNAEDEKERVKITLKYRDGREIVKELFKWPQFSADGKDKLAIKFTLPVADKGLGLLTFRDPVKRDVHWLKKPSLRNIRRLPIRDESEYFGGIDLTIEDLTQSVGERQIDFLYQLVESNKDFWVIEALPKEGIATGYAKRIFWIDKQSVLRKVEYYERNEGLLKVQRNMDIHISAEGRWRANRIEIENIHLGRTTTIEIEDRQIDSRLSADIFTKGFLLINRPAGIYQNM
jgi:hypothetical protein